MPSIQILGHKVDTQGISPNPDLVKAIQEAPTPDNADQVRSFLGLVGYYSKFVPNFANQVQHIRDTMAQTCFTWTTTAQTAFDKIKQMIINSNALALFDPLKDTIVTTDASGYGLGAVMTQLHNGHGVTVCFASRKLTAQEQNYSTGEREALACVWATEKWHTYLWGRPFILRTDHQALTTLLSTTGTGHKPMRIARWAARLLHYTYTVEYKPGTENVVADALSRLPLDISSNVHDQSTCDVNNEDETAAVCHILLDGSSISKGQLINATADDDTLIDFTRLYYYRMATRPK